MRVIRMIRRFLNLVNASGAERKACAGGVVSGAPYRRKDAVQAPPYVTVRTGVGNSRSSPDVRIRIPRGSVQGVRGGSDSVRASKRVFGKSRRPNGPGDPSPGLRPKA